MKRIQRKRTKGWRMPEGAVYVGRPTRWGNPAPIGSDLEFGDYGPDRIMLLVETPELSLALYRLWADDTAHYSPAFLSLLRDATALACWCPLDQPCHADVLIALLEDTA